MSPEAASSSLEEQAEKPIHLADLAERLLASLESHFSLELFPSLPTPEELEAIYTWDERLLIDSVGEPTITPTVTAVLN